MVAWGGSYGAVHQAVKQAQKRGLSVAHLHLRYLNPLPANLGEVLARYERILVPEMNMGQMRMLLEARYHIPMEGLNKVQGKPFFIREVYDKIVDMLEGSKR